MMKRKTGWKWDFEKRIDFQSLLKQGYNLSKIRDIWAEYNSYDVLPSLQSMSREVKMGLDEDEKENSQFVKYDLIKVYKNLIGENAVKYIMKHGDEL